MRISYKLPLIGIILVLGLTIVFILGVHGYIDNSFNQSPTAQKYVLIIFVIEVIYVFISPRNREIVVNFDGIYVPNVLLPPFRVKRFKWRDIKRIKIKTGHADDGDIKVATLYTNDDSAKIDSRLCLPNFYFIMTNEKFHYLMNVVNAFVSLDRNLRWLFLQIKNNNSIDPAVKRRISKLMEDMIDRGTASRDELMILMELINYEVFDMSIAERRKIYRSSGLFMDTD